MASLATLIERLATTKVEFVVVGGLAVLMYGAGLVTEDVDVCIPFTDQNLSRVEAALKDLHPYHRMTPQRIPFDLKSSNTKSARNLYLKTDLGPLDLLGEVLGIGDYAAVLAESVPVQTTYGEYRLLSLEGIIKAKRAMNREKDRAAVRLLSSIKTSQPLRYPTQDQL